MYDVLNKGLGTLEKGLAYFCAGVLFLMMCLISSDVVLRYFFSRPITGVDEIVKELFMPAIVFLTMSFVLHAEGHVNVTFVLEYFSAKVKKVIQLCSHILGILFFAFVAYGSFQRTVTAWQNNEFSSSLLAYPMAPAYFLVVIGSVLMMLRFIMLMIQPCHKVQKHMDE